MGIGHFASAVLGFAESGRQAMKRLALAILPLAILLSGLVPASCAPVSEVPQPKVELPERAQQAFEKYQSPRIFGDFRAFAVDLSSGAWGRTWRHYDPQPAIDRALQFCRKWGQACELYAIGNTIVLGMSPEEVATVTKEYRDQPNLVVFEEYRSSPKFSDFKAFALDSNSVSWGHGWAQSNPKLAIDRALLDCRIRSGNLTASPKCELYAVGNTVVSRMSPEQLASVTEDYFAAVAKAAGFSRSITHLGAIQEVGERMSSDEIKFYLSGRRIEGIAVNGSRGAVKFSADGTMSGSASMLGDIELGRTERGAWWVKDDQLCGQWQRWLGNTMGCLFLVKDGDTFRAYALDGDIISKFTVLERTKVPGA